MLNRVEVMLVRVTCFILLALTGIKLVFAKIEDLGNSFSGENRHRTNQQERLPVPLADPAPASNRAWTNWTGKPHKPSDITEGNPPTHP